MSRRGSRSFRRFSRGKRDYIWCTTRVDQTIADDELLSITTLVSPSDWEASTTGFDRGTIVAIRGWLNIAQMASATNADQSTVMSYIAKNSSAASTAFTPLTAASYDSTDVMWCTGTVLAASVAGDRARLDTTVQLDVRTKRKIDSSEVLQIVSAMDIDTASPTAAICGIVRVLVQRA